MNLKIDIRSVEHAHFLLHIDAFQKRAAEDHYDPTMRKSWSDIADLLEQAAVMSVYELEAFQATLPGKNSLPQGSFARSRAAMIIDDYLDQIEALMAGAHRPFIRSLLENPEALAG